MENIKIVVSRNLLKLRKKHKLTQAELAEKINYSDKAISRWENGEVTPDVETLSKIADVYCIEISALFDKDLNVEEVAKNNREQLANRIAITCLCSTFVWVLAALIYFYVFTFQGINAWQVFICAIPVSLIVAFACSSRWWDKVLTYVFLSLALWTSFAAIYVTMISYELWLIFILGIPIQVSIILYSRIKKDPMVNERRSEIDND